MALKYFLKQPLRSSSVHLRIYLLYLHVRDIFKYHFITYPYEIVPLIGKSAEVRDNVWHHPVLMLTLTQYSTDANVA